MSPIRSSLLLGAGDAAAGGFQVSRSLRFNSADSAYLSRNFSSGNQKIWTWSAWIKRGKLGSEFRFFDARSGGLQQYIKFNSSDNLRVLDSNGTLITSQVFRDPSAWYHVLVAFDTTQSTASNRIKLYVNGSRVTAFSSESYPTQNSDILFNSAVTHSISWSAGTTEYFDGYLANIHFIDGQQLDPSSFTEVSATTGQLIPKAFSGSYGLVADSTGALPIFNTTGAQGAVKGTGTRTDTNSASIVLAVPMDGTNGGTSFGDQSAVIRGSGSAKTVTVNGNTNTSTAQSKFYGSSGSFDGTGDYLSLSSSADFQIWNSTSWTVECFIYINSLASSFYFFGAGDRASTTTRVLFSFNSSGNFILDWDGTSSDSTTTFTTGLSANNWYHLAVVSNGTTCKVYINGAQASTTATLGTSTQANAPISIGVPGLAANPATYNGLNGYIQDFRIYKGVAKYTSNFIVPTPNSFYLQFADNSSNTASTLGKDTSGNGNNWTPNNLSVTAGAGNDSLVDTPTSYGTDTGVGGEVRGNYATLNALRPASYGSAILTNGNLNVAQNTTAYVSATSTIGVSSGKWYWEVTCTSIGFVTSIGITSNLAALAFDTGVATYHYDGGKYINGSNSAYGSSYTTGDIIGFALDLDSGTLVCYKNGVTQGTLISGLSGIYYAYITMYSTWNVDFNFGQRPFAYQTPGTNRPAATFKALCDTNLGAPLVAKPNTLMDVVTYSGDGSTSARAISGLNFSPNFVWIKGRNITYSHLLYDTVRDVGPLKGLNSNETRGEGASVGDDSTFGYLSAFNSNGFSVIKGSDATSYVNGGSSTYVAWCWDAGEGSAVSNTAGSITSQVRANVSAGFSVVTLTYSGGVVTVGHGLGVAPQMIIVKRRNTTGNWYVAHTGLTSMSGHYLLLESTAAQGAASWGGAPTSTVFNMSTSIFGSGDYVAYCFSPVVGYSSFGSYVGNGSSDGPFVYLGFKPRWIMLKLTNAVSDWWIYDTARDTYNVMGSILYPNLSSAEYVDTSVFGRDILSNGFKVRTSNGTVNGNGYTYIYAAFAENPFQYARAR